MSDSGEQKDRKELEDHGLWWWCCWWRWRETRWRVVQSAFNYSRVRNCATSSKSSIHTQTNWFDCKTNQRPDCWYFVRIALFTTTMHKATTAFSMLKSSNINQMKKRQSNVCVRSSLVGHIFSCSRRTVDKAAHTLTVFGWSQPPCCGDVGVVGDDLDSGLWVCIWKRKVAAHTRRHSVWN